MTISLAQCEDNLTAASQRVLHRLEQEFEILKNTDAEKARSFAFGFANAHGELGPDGGPHKAAPLKYLRDARAQIRKFYRFMPYITGPKKMFEIGVGAGHLFRLLMDVHGVEMLGCDIAVDKTHVYREIRKELGIQHLVLEHAVMSHQPLPLAENTEAVVAFWTAFNSEWKLNDHLWFLDHLRENLVGRKLVALRFNRDGFNDNQPVYDYYQRNATFPLDEPARALGDNFCYLEL